MGHNERLKRKTQQSKLEMKPQLLRSHRSLAIRAPSRSLITSKYLPSAKPIQRSMKLKLHLVAWRKSRAFSNSGRLLTKSDAANVFVYAISQIRKDVDSPQV